MKTALCLVLFAAPLFAAEPLTDRPAPDKRRFHSEAVEKTIAAVTKDIADPQLGAMFAKCFPNTVDTTVFFSEQKGTPDAYVITGDIDAMWMRDSSAQVNQYIPLAKNDAALATMLKGLIGRQTRCTLLDPYANAFYPDPHRESQWKSDHTDMRPGVHERKYELDSLCYPIRLGYQYWKATGDLSVFGDEWLKAMRLSVDTMRVQQRKTGKGPYSFMRETQWQTDTVPGAGYGNPCKPNGMICSTFRNSDDAATYLFNIPENLLAVTTLRHLGEILDALNREPALAADARALAAEAEAATLKAGVITHPKYGRIYAYECDGFGNVLMMDDAGLPSLIGIPYLGYGSVTDEIYQNTRRFALSADNPYFYRGKAGEGTGSPHLAAHGDFIWPMGLSSRGLTASDPEEIRLCLRLLRDTAAGTGFMHEGFNKEDANDFTRPWFAWANSLFSEFVLKVHQEHPEILRASLAP